MTLDSLFFVNSPFPAAGYVPSNVLRAQIRNAMWTPQRDQGPSTTFSGPSRLEEQEQVLWVLDVGQGARVGSGRIEEHCTWWLWR